MLVGQSIGIYATIYTDKRPDKVAGLVLIDHAYVGADLTSRDARGEGGRPEGRGRKLADIKRCADIARADALTQDDPNGCSPGRLDEKAYLAWSWTRPTKYEAQASEMQAAFSLSTGRTRRQEQTRAARPCGDNPMIVMTSGKDFDHAPTAAPSATRNGRRATTVSPPAPRGASR